MFVNLCVTNYVEMFTTKDRGIALKIYLPDIVDV